MTEHDAIEQLAALLDGHDVPDAPSSLGGLATLAENVRNHADTVAPTAEFRTSLRAELVAAAEAPPGLAEQARTAWISRTGRLRTTARMAVATMTASSMIGTAGVAVGAQEALPGEMLYGLKGLTEDARLLLATDAVAEARLHLVFARERLEELQATAGQLDTDQVVALLAEMDAHSEAGAEAMFDGVTVGVVNPDEVRAFTAAQRSGLVAVLNDLPLLAKPVAEDSLELLRRIEVTATGIVPATTCDCGADELLARTAPAAQREAVTTTPTDLLALNGTTDVVAPGDGPAVPAEDCDCIELADDPESSASGTTEGGTEDDSGTSEEEPFEPTGELTSPETDTEEDEDGERTLDLSSSLDDASEDETTDEVEEDSGVDSGVDSDSVDRLEDGLDDAIS